MCFLLGGQARGLARWLTRTGPVWPDDRTGGQAGRPDRKLGSQTARPDGAAAKRYSPPAKVDAPCAEAVRDVREGVPASQMP